MVSSGGMNYAQAALRPKVAEKRVVLRDKAGNRVFAGFLRCPGSPNGFAVVPLPPLLGEGPWRTRGCKTVARAFEAQPSAACIRCGSQGR